MQFSDRTIERGGAYYSDGRVTATRRHGRTILATVSGSRAVPYTVTMDLDQFDRSRCTCPVRYACKHLVAAVLAVWMDPEAAPELHEKMAAIAAASGIVAASGVAAAQGLHADTTSYRLELRSVIERAREDLERRARETSGGDAAADDGPRGRHGASKGVHQGDGRAARARFVDDEDLAAWRMALLVDADHEERPQVSLIRQYRRLDGTWGRLQPYQGERPVFVPDEASRRLVDRLRVLGGAAPVLAFAGELTRTRLPLFAGGPASLSGCQDYPVRVVRPGRLDVDVIPVPTSRICFGPAFSPAPGPGGGPLGPGVSVTLNAGMRVTAGRSRYLVPPGSSAVFDEGVGYTVASFAADAGLVLIDRGELPLSRLRAWFDRRGSLTPATLVDLIDLAARHPDSLSVSYPYAVRVQEHEPEPVFTLRPTGDALVVRLDLEEGTQEDGYEGDEYVVNVLRFRPPEELIDAVSRLTGAVPHGDVPWAEPLAESYGPWFWEISAARGARDPFAVARALVDRGYTVYVENRHGRRAARRSYRLTVAVRSGTDWFAPVVSEANTGQLTVGELEELAATGRLEEGDRYILFSPGEVDRIRELLDLTQGAPQSRIPRWDIDSFAMLDELADEVPADLEPVRELAKELIGGETAETPLPPPGLSATLRPYQHEGFAWLASLARHGVSGCLADDMGLGKTVQALALMLHLQHADSGTSSAAESAEKPAGGFLVIAPLSTLGNWAREAARFAPRLTTLVHHGSARTTNTSGLLDAQLIVTSYGTAVRDSDLLAGVHWELVVLDEAQAIKNPHARTTAQVKRLQSRLRLCLTGTPVENVSTDLWSIMDFLVPGLLGSLRQFKHRFPRRNINGTAQSAGRLARLRRIVSPFLLRRTKDLVAPELPPKVESVVSCRMGPKQAAFYERLRAYHRARVAEAISGGDRREIGAAVFTGLLRLRQAAIRPVDADRTGLRVPSVKQEELLNRIDEVVQEGHKALVFSQFVSALSALHSRAAAGGITTLYLDGSTRDRDPLIRRFQETHEPCVFFISLRAGGTGINLTAADYVFICDPWWNPQVERQAVDRAHRIGRERPVIVTRLVTAGTIEQKVLELQAQKQALVSEVITENPAGIDLRSAEELLRLFDEVG